MPRILLPCALALLQIGATPADVVGLWVGLARHEGQSTEIGLRLEDAGEGRLRAVVSVPAMNILDMPFGPATVEGARVNAGPFVFERSGETLKGMLPEALVPVYAIPVELRRTTNPWTPRKRTEPPVRVVAPAWTFDAGGAIWAGVAEAEGRVYAGTENGVLHALDAKTGSPTWSFRAGGPIRARPTLAHGSVYLHGDDGYVYRLGAADGKERWRVQVDEKPPVRLPPGPQSRFDRWGSAVTASGDRLYVGTHDGRLLALDASRGAVVWTFRAGDSMLAAPAVSGGRVVFGSYDGKVYAVDERTGALRWTHDAKKPVVSTPAVDGGRVVVGSRSYDLLGLDTNSGQPAWKRYLWFSWIESSAVVRDGIAYVGSSDAGKLFAVETKTGAPAWETDVYGWPWATPAVTAERVYAGTIGDLSYPAPGRGGLVALDRSSGAPVWWHPLPAPTAPGLYGVPGPVAAARGFVYVGTLDGRVLAFRDPD
jgi:outer membrane protein assembly factor BamB